MAVNISRSQNAELNEGATDGKYRKVRPHTTVDPGMGDDLVRANRRGLHPFWNYDFIDAEEMNRVSPGSNKAGVVSSRKDQTPVAAMEDLTTQNY